MAMFNAGFLDVQEEAGRGRLPAISLFGHDAGRMAVTESPVGEFGVTQGIADLLKPFMDLSRPVGATVLEHELVDGELSALLTPEQPDSQWLASGHLLDGFPDVTVEEVDLPALREVEALGPGVAVVDDEVDGSVATIPTPTILAAVIDVLAGNTSLDDRPLQDALKLCYIVYWGTCLMDPLLPLRDFLPEGFCGALPPQDTLEVLDDALSDAVQVTILEGG